ncbi:MAG: zinc transporter ZntB [Alcanivoracaceae bacterium]|nr:zinc transporter ZntB [Alcanivoracaceae bacterium]
MLANGLVHAVVLDGNGGGTFLNAQEALARTPDQPGVLWLHFDYTDPSAQKWISEQSGLDTVASDALLTLDTRPRASNIKNSLLIYLRGVNLNPGAAPEDMIAIRLLVQPNRIISTQKRSLASVRELLAAVEQGDGVKTSGEIVADLVDRLTWYMDEVIAKIEDNLSSLEEKTSGRLPVKRNQITDSRRRIVVLRRYLAPQREALARLQMESLGLLSDADKLLVQEAADRLLRLMEDLDMFRDHASLAQEELQSQLSDQLNQRMYVLAVLSGLFLPLGFLTGLFGINLGGMPGAANDSAFYVFVASLSGMLLIGGGYLYWRNWFK